jgi:hypothetical protein
VRRYREPAPERLIDSVSYRRRLDARAKNDGKASASLRKCSQKRLACVREIEGIAEIIAFRQIHGEIFPGVVIANEKVV